MAVGQLFGHHHSRLWEKTKKVEKSYNGTDADLRGVDGIICPLSRGNGVLNCQDSKGGPVI
jgi:hypothetical protein